MITTELLPIRNMLGKDWKKIYAGLTMSCSRDWHMASENSFALKILHYLLNTQLHISNYTAYSKLIWDLEMRIGSPYFYPDEAVVISEYGETYLMLNLYWLDAHAMAKANKHQALQIFAQIFLDSIPKHLFNRDDFDGEKFYQDVLPIVKPIADGTRVFKDEEFPM